MSEANDKGRELCRQVDEQMAELLDGTASDELYDHVADCDRCRDARYDAEQVAELVEDSGADFVVPEDFSRRVLNAVDAVAGGETTASGPSTKRGLADDRPAASDEAKPEPKADDAAKPEPPPEEEPKAEETSPPTKRGLSDPEPKAEESEPAPTTDRMAEPEADAERDAASSAAAEAVPAGATQVASPFLTPVKTAMVAARKIQP